MLFGTWVFRRVEATAFALLLLVGCHSELDAPNQASYVLNIDESSETALVKTLPDQPIAEGNALDYFERLKVHPAVIFADTLCHPSDTGWYASHKRGGSIDVHPYASYDPALDAMRLDLPETNSKLGSGKGVDVYWPKLDPTDEVMVVKYRMRLSKAIVLTGAKYKFINLLRYGDKIGIELRTWFDSEKAYSRVDIRSYFGNGEGGRDNPLSSPVPDLLREMHPGPDSTWTYRKPLGPPAEYVLYPDKWYVSTCEVSRRGDQLAYRHWFEDGENPACLWMASPTDASLGFRLASPATLDAITGIYFELDQSSGETVYTEPQPRRSVWFDDLIVMKGVRGENTLGNEPGG